MFELKVFGIENLQRHIHQIDSRFTKMRSSSGGMKRIAGWLLKEKKNKCKMGLYSGQEVAPNKWKYGWEHLGGPAIYHFTKSVLNAHHVGNVRYDFASVVLEVAEAPHAAVIHGSFSSISARFFSPRLNKWVKQRPWMKVTREEKEMCIQILTYTYRGGDTAHLMSN